MTSKHLTNLNLTVLSANIKYQPLSLATKMSRQLTEVNGFTH